MLTYNCQLLLHGLSDHVGHGDIFNPQRRINGFMFFCLSALNLGDHLGLVISPQSPLSAGYITLRVCRRSLPLRFTTVTAGGIVGFNAMSSRRTSVGQLCKIRFNMSHSSVTITTILALRTRRLKNQQTVVLKVKQFLLFICLMVERY